ncbi:MAG: hypothetical protein JO114_12370 [Planctomycetaceae bacterium]|nr:hypothetical protein [Planctomycetaceae bacterium]
MLVRAVDNVRPGIVLELAGDADELESVLGGQERPRDRDPEQGRRKKDDREPETAPGHPDPP